MHSAADNLWQPRITLDLTTGQASGRCLLSSSVIITLVCQSYVSRLGRNSDQKRAGYYADGGYTKTFTVKYGASARYLVSYEAAARRTSFIQIN
jgi:hypothetical protein